MAHASCPLHPLHARLCPLSWKKNGRSICDAKNRSMLSDEQHALYLRYLQNPPVVAEATATMSRGVAASLRHRILENYTLGGSEILRKADNKHVRIRYAARTLNAFRIFANIQSQLNRQGINRTHDKVIEN